MIKLIKNDPNDQYEKAAINYENAEEWGVGVDRHIVMKAAGGVALCGFRFTKAVITAPFKLVNHIGCKECREEYGKQTKGVNQ